ncbi:amidase family protein [Neptunomonas antarctica]|uniref:amidase family protein n=1 Tax=Neptunomonas antarctica TaxID=619304 RepID=UPI00192E67B7
MNKFSDWLNRTDELSPSLKVCMFVGQYGLDQYHGRYYDKAQNLARKARAGYDKALDDYDLLIMPTVPILAQPLPKTDCSVAEYITRAF